MTIKEVSNNAANLARELAILYLGYLVGGWHLVIVLFVGMLLVSLFWALLMGVLYAIAGNLEHG